MQMSDEIRVRRTGFAGYIKDRRPDVIEDGNYVLVHKDLWRIIQEKWSQQEQEEVPEEKEKVPEKVPENLWQMMK